MNKDLVLIRNLKAVSKDVKFMFPPDKNAKARKARAIE